MPNKMPRALTRARSLLSAPVLAAALASAAVTGALHSVSAPAQAEVPPAVLQQVPSLAPMLQPVLPSVVSISVSKRVESMDPRFRDPQLRRFFGVPDEIGSFGSGVIVDAAKGYILTNHHVVEHAEEIKVGLRDDREIAAKLVGSDAETDIAVLQVEPRNLDAITVGDSSKMQVGDFVVAIGSPFGLRQTVTSGIVSALSRTTAAGLEAGRYEEFIQTDASINPGNSGGALVNLRGELVGINSQIYSESGGNIGIGFAIPSNQAMAVLAQIVEFGSVQRGKLGIVGQSLTPDLAAAFGLERNRGVIISQVVPDSPAAKAGIQTGDVILEANGVEVRDMVDLRNRIGLMRVGQELSMKLLRDGRTISVTARIGSDADEPASGGKLHARLQGAKFGPISPEHPLAGQVKGVMVTDLTPGSAAARAGLREGDIITSVNRKDVASMADFERQAGGEGQLLLHVLRGRGALFIVIQ